MSHEIKNSKILSKAVEIGLNKIWRIWIISKYTNINIIYVLVFPVILYEKLQILKNADNQKIIVFALVREWNGLNRVPKHLRNTVSRFWKLFSKIQKGMLDCIGRKELKVFCSWFTTIWNIWAVWKGGIAKNGGINEVENRNQPMWKMSDHDPLCEEEHDKIVKGIFRSYVSGCFIYLIYVPSYVRHRKICVLLQLNNVDHIRRESQNGKDWESKRKALWIKFMGCSVVKGCNCIFLRYTM